MFLQKIIFMQPTDVARGAFDDIGEKTAGAVLLDDALHHIGAVGAPFGDFDEWIFFFELLGDRLEPGVGVVENHLAFFLGALNEELFPVSALVEGDLSSRHRRIGGAQAACGKTRRPQAKRQQSELNRTQPKHRHLLGKLAG